MNVVAHNLMAMNASRQLNIVTDKCANTTERLSSGYRINRAADDAAGLAISEKMRYQIRGLYAGADNIQEAIQFCKVADGALSEVHDMLGRMKTLAVKAANDTNTVDDRAMMTQEIQALAKEINRVSATTEFNEYRIFTDDYKVSLSGTTNVVKTFDDADGNMAGFIVGGSKTTFPGSFTYVDADTGERRFHQGEFSYQCGTTTVKVSAGEGAMLPNITATFEVKAAQSGITVAGTTIGWDHVYFDDGTSVKSNPQAGGMCHFNILGGEGGFSIPEGQSLDGIADTINQMITQNERVYTTSLVGRKTADSSIVDDSTGRFRMKLEENRLFCIQSGSDIKQNFGMNWQPFSAHSLGVRGASVNSASEAGNLIMTIDSACDVVSSIRSTFGAYTNLFEHMYKSNLNSAENLQASESVIRDADMSKLAVEAAMQHILEQVGQSMLSQTNQNSDRLLQLLSG